VGSHGVREGKPETVTYTKVTTKDGRILEGAVWYYNRQSWYLTVPAVTDDLLYLRDLESAVSESGLDYLEQARLDGWDGKS